MCRLDVHTPCIACPAQVRTLYAAGRRVLGGRLHQLTTPEYDELYAALEELRPFIEAHHTNQQHAFSDELAGAREPRVPELV
jgi:hypothetical protein